MEQLRLAPLVRGAYLAAGGRPVILRFDDADRAELPTLDPGAAASEGDEAIGACFRNLLTSQRTAGSSLPAGVRIPGVGCFYAGHDADSAEAARRGEAGRLHIGGERGRGDVVRGRIALVTGGAQGFGAEIARGLADAGAFVIVADINAEGAEAFAAELNAGGVRRAAAAAVDVSDEDSVRALAGAAAGEAGGLDLLVSNAGVLRAGSVLELEARDFDFVTRINYSAFFLVVKHLAPLMIRQRAAAPQWTSDIVQINSKSGLAGSNKNAAYAGGKFGGIGLVQSFAMELVDYGIKVNAVCPGNFFDGPLWSDPEKGLFVQYLQAGKVPGATSIADVKAFYEAKVPMGRGCGGEDVLKAIFYCVDQAYETGQAVPVTGGQIMLK